MQSPNNFPALYDLDALHRQGVSVKGASEQEFICFGRNYEGEVLPGIKIGDSLEAAAQLLGEPQFFNAALNYVGYRTEGFYFALEGKDIVDRIVFVKNYKLPEGYDSIITDYLSDQWTSKDFLNKYPLYSFLGQLYRGGRSLIYPFGLEFHEYTGAPDVFVYSNYGGVVPKSKRIEFVEQDGAEIRLKNFFSRNNIPETGITSPDGKKIAFEHTWIGLYEYNNVYVYSTDDSFSPRVFLPGYWVDDMRWLDDNLLLYRGGVSGEALGFYSFDDDEVFRVAEAGFDSCLIDELLSVDMENRAARFIVKGSSQSDVIFEDEKLLIVRWDNSDGFSYHAELTDIGDYTQ
jgi:hypothetical protein